MKVNALLINISLVVLFFLWSNFVEAIGVSTKRIYLDERKSEENFVVTNRENMEQTCQLSITHYDFKENGLLVNYKVGEKPHFSAESKIRFSPKKFDIAAKSKQTVRFVMRRQKNALAQELRSHLVVLCKPKVTRIPQTNVGNNLVDISLSPVLAHHIPIVVRPKEIKDVSAEIKNITYSKGTLNFDLFRQGNRSIYGKVEVINSDNNEVVTKSQAFPIYIESNKKNLALSVNSDIPPEKLILRFTEDKKEGGTIIAEKKFKH